MYRFLIIDDEPIVREGIARTINWEEHGFELVGVFRDGREGLEGVEQLRPDVILSDVCMPFVDGLELAATVAAQYPRIKTILLTGYDEFEYAQEAVRLNVRDFILKPITAAELREVLGTLRQELDEEHAQFRNSERQRQQLTESLPLLQERFLNGLIRQNTPMKDAMQRAELLELQLPGPRYHVLLCDQDRDTSEAPAEVSFSEITVQHEIAKEAQQLGDVVVFGTLNDQVVILVSLPETGDPLPASLRVAEAVSDHVERTLGRTISIGIGDVVSSLDQLPRGFETARVALEQRFVLGPRQIISMDQVRGNNQPPVSQQPTERRGEFIQALKTADPAMAVAAVRRVLEPVVLQGDIGEVLVVTNRILADALNTLDALEVDYRGMMEVGDNPFATLGRMKTIQEIYDWFEQFIRHASTALDSRREQHSLSKVRGAEQYIREMYQDRTLALQDVCTALAVSKSYLTMVFKKHTGMTIVEYLTEVRMEEAKALLRGSDLRVYEIAEQVGYRDAHYFSLTFRKQVGQTPSEYRESLSPAVQP